MRNGITNHPYLESIKIPRTFSTVSQAIPNLIEAVMNRHHRHRFHQSRHQIPKPSSTASQALPNLISRPSLIIIASTISIKIATAITLIILRLLNHGFQALLERESLTPELFIRRTNHVQVS